VYNLGVTRSERAGARNTDPLVVNTLEKRASTMIIVSSNDPHGPTAAALAAAADQWQPVRLLEESAADPCGELVLERLPSGEFAWLRPARDVR
jgi:hypothetical protein